MLFNPAIHSFAHLAKTVLGHFEKMRGGLNYSKEELIVLNYHSTPAKLIADFKKQITFLRNNFNILSPAQLDDYYSGRLSSNKCNLLLTFDDGLANNLYAAKVLDEYNLKALFFVVPDFINCPATEQKKYYLKNIRPVVNPAIDHEEEDFTALNWDALKKLIEKGHGIGAHTYTHTLVASQSSTENSVKEIVDCKTLLESRLQIKIRSFCSINNTLESIGSKEKKLIEENYSYHFTTLPGYNAGNKDKLFIKRRNVECFWTSGSFYYALGKSDLSRWEEKIKKYNSL